MMMVGSTMLEWSVGGSFVCVVCVCVCVCVCVFN